MKKALATLAIVAILAVVLASGCTQQPAGPDGGGGATVKTSSAEDQAATVVEGELDQAVANMTEVDVETALLNQ